MWGLFEEHLSEASDKEFTSDVPDCVVHLHALFPGSPGTFLTGPSM